MPKKSKILTEVDSGTREKLNKKLVENGFSQYIDLADWLSEQGYTISKSSIHRYGKKLAQEYQAIAIAQSQAQVIAETLGDDEEAMSIALTKISQNKLMDAVVGVDVGAYLEEDVVKNLPKLVGAIVKLNQSSVNLKKFQWEQKRRAELAAKEITQVAISGGLSDTSIDLIQQQIMGVVK